MIRRCIITDIVYTVWYGGGLYNLRPGMEEVCVDIT